MNSHQDLYILAIESSCDDTCAAIMNRGKVLSNITNTQKVHQRYGGVVPELASRDHLRAIVPVVHEAFRRAQIDKSQIHAIACTQGPGLIGSLMVGTSFAKGMAQGLSIPLIAVHHMHAHIMAHFIEHPDIQLPFLCLTVSGGHTQLIKVNAPKQFELLGQTIDDAAGEAFDKGAKLLQLPYPGGPIIDKYAKKGDPHRYTFANTIQPNYNFSYSGLKTSLLYFIQKMTKQFGSNFIQENIHDLCASYQKTILDQLETKLLQAAITLDIKTIAIAGGVSANSALRERMIALRQRGYETYIPAYSYCTDNAAMIGITAYYHFLAGDFVDIRMSAKARLSF